MVQDDSLDLLNPPFLGNDVLYFPSLRMQREDIVIA